MIRSRNVTSTMRGKTSSRRTRGERLGGGAGADPEPARQYGYGEQSQIVSLRAQLTEAKYNLSRLSFAHQAMATLLRY